MPPKKDTSKPKVQQVVSLPKSVARVLRSQSTDMTMQMNAAELAKLIQDAIRAERIESETGLRNIIREEVATAISKHKEQLDSLSNTITQHGSSISSVETALSQLTESKSLRKKMLSSGRRTAQGTPKSR